MPRVLSVVMNNMACLALLVTIFSMRAAVATGIESAPEPQQLQHTYHIPDPLPRLQRKFRYLRRTAHSSIRLRRRRLSQTSANSNGQEAVIAEPVDCAQIAPCHVKGDASGTGSNQKLTCVKFYAKRFWDNAPTALVEELHWQRDNRPENCWYETELLALTKKVDASDTGTSSTMPYDNAVCPDNYALPETMVYWHNFKVAGTTARHALGYKDVPQYEPATNVFSDMLLEIFPDATYDDFALYLGYADEKKKEVYDRQVNHEDKNVAFTFVRNPVQRFLSGLDQVERLNNNDWEVSDEARPCFNMQHPLGKVECVVDAILDTGVFFNVHLYPQSYLFDEWTKQGAYDTAITVLNLKDMDPLLKRITGEDVERARESKVEGTKINLQEKDLHQRLLVKICTLYKADLLLLKTLGMEDPLCGTMDTTAAREKSER